MDKAKMMDMALEKIMGELDEVEGHSAMEHSLEDCPDPFTCEQHSGELGKNLAPEPAAVKIEIHKPGMPSLDGETLPDSSVLNMPMPDWVIEAESHMTGAIHALLTMEVPGKSVRLNITMDEALVSRLDADARREGTTRSGYLAQAVRERLQRGHEMA